MMKKKSHTRRSAEDSIARCRIDIHGRVGAMRGTVLESPRALTGRRFRRANKLTREEANLLGGMIHGAVEAASFRKSALDFEDVRRLLIGPHLT